MHAAASLKIAKYTLSVDVRTFKGEERTIAVYVAQELNVDGRSERLQDIFASRRFVPVGEGRALEFISTRHVEWIKLDLIGALDELDPQAEEGTGASSSVVRATLESGTTLEGVLRYYMPQGMRRLSDFLESGQQWIPLRTDDFLYLINRDRVVHVAPVGA